MCDGCWYPVGYRRAPSHIHKGKKYKYKSTKTYKKYIKELSNGANRFCARGCAPGECHMWWDQRSRTNLLSLWKPLYLQVDLLSKETLIKASHMLCISFEVESWWINSSMKTNFVQHQIIEFLKNLQTKCKWVTLLVC